MNIFPKAKTIVWKRYEQDWYIAHKGICCDVQEVIENLFNGQDGCHTVEKGCCRRILGDTMGLHFMNTSLVAIKLPKFVVYFLRFGQARGRELN